jgi:hypothetical protein
VEGVMQCTAAGGCCCYYCWPLPQLCTQPVSAATATACQYTTHTVLHEIVASHGVDCGSCLTLPQLHQ